MRVKLTSGEAVVEIDYHGAELKSFVKNGKEYMWTADPQFWGRTAPVLFPTVGQVADGVYRHEGSQYKLPQHGFARDMDFDLVASDESSALFRLESNEETMAKFPFEFVFEIGYILEGSKLYVSWMISNPADKDLHFSIGSHPGFNCKLNEIDLKLYKEGKPVEQYEKHMFIEGLFSGQYKTVATPAGVIDMDEHTFDEDTIAIEDSQVDKVELCKKGGEPMVTMEFDMPLLGIWSPPGKDAPFVCIEPWCGRADQRGFEGQWAERPWANVVAPGESFNRTYSIELNQIDCETEKLQGEWIITHSVFFVIKNSTTEIEKCR